MPAIRGGSYKASTKADTAQRAPGRASKPGMPTKTTISTTAGTARAGSASSKPRFGILPGETPKARVGSGMRFGIPSGETVTGRIGSGTTPTAPKTGATKKPTSGSMPGRPSVGADRPGNSRGPSNRAIDRANPNASFKRAPAPTVAPKKSKKTTATTRGSKPKSIAFGGVHKTGIKPDKLPIETATQRMQRGKSRRVSSRRI